MARSDRGVGWLWLAGLILVACPAPPALAHGDLPSRIEQLAARIEAHPADALLYLKRAELHRLHRHWDAALRDYRMAERLEPGLEHVDFYEGRMWLEAGNPEKAEPLLDRFLALEPGHAAALLVRSRVLAEMGRPIPAAEDLQVALLRMESPNPEIYLERAKLLVAEGATYIDDGIRAIEEGIAELGPFGHADSVCSRVGK